VAVTAAAEGLCLACRLSFPPQFYIELQRNEKISVCPNCGRLIYWRDHPDFKAAGGA
jgi:predicted  nucleic acid-binding Zn-ribbon protein